MKLTTRVNFINVLQAAFTLIDPKSVKKIDNLPVFFALLGPAQVNTVHRTLMKLTPGVNFINILRASFSYKSKSSSFFSNYVWLCNFLAPKYRQKTRA